MTFEFATRTGIVRIARAHCAGCSTRACIDACARYGVGLLTLVDGAPALDCPPDEAQRRDNECLACEEACRLRGHGAITIVLPISGLDDTAQEEPHGDPAG